VIAGGVGANRRLRERLAEVAREAGAELYFPRTEFCTDNGAMIALAGCMRLAPAHPGRPSARARIGISAIAGRRCHCNRGLESSMDKIFIHALKTEAIIGIFDWERQVKQTVLVDIEISADIRKAALSDSIDDTLNYKRVAKRVLAFVEESSFTWSKPLPSTSPCSFSRTSGLAGCASR
jgi:hypothetical protein